MVVRHFARQGVAYGFIGGDDLVNIVAGNAACIKVTHLADIVASLNGAQ